MNNVQTRAQREADPSYRIFPDNIPDELKAKDRWVLWRLELRDGKPTKVPVNAGDGNRASVDDPDTWAPWPVALAQAQKHRMGVGYVLDGTDDFYAIDLDAKSELSNEAGQILSKCHSYTEISPGGRGRRIFLKGQLPEGFTGGRSTQAQIEVYQSLRYLTVTGDRVNGHDTILFDQETTDEVISLVAKKKSPLPEVDWPTAEGEGPESWEVTVRPNDTGDQSADDHAFIKDLLRIHPDGEWAWGILCEVAGRPKLDRPDYKIRTVTRAWQEVQAERNVVEDLLGDVDTGVASLAAEKQAPLACPLTALDLFTMVVSGQDPSPVPGLLGTGLWTFAGPPKKGKSWVALLILLCMSTGKRLFGHLDVKTQPGLYYALEDGPERLAKRLQALGIKPGPDFHVRFEMESLQSLVDTILAVGAKVVIIDTKIMAMQALLAHNPEAAKKMNKMDAYERETALLKPLKKIADDLGITIVLITHLRKSKDDNDPFNQIMGSVAAQAVPNGAIMLEAVPRRKDLVKLSVRARDIEENEWTLAREESTPNFRVVDEEEVVSEGTAEILNILRARGRARVGNLVEYTELHRVTIQKALRTLEDRGLVRCQNHWWEAVNVVQM